MNNSDFNMVYCMNDWSPSSAHHQGPLCKELAGLLKERFKLCILESESTNTNRELILSGFHDQQCIVNSKGSFDHLNMIHDIVCNADVAILNARTMDNLKEKRIATGKLTFLTSERLTIPRFHFLQSMLKTTYVKLIDRLREYSNKENVYYLPIGNHAAKNALSLGLFKARMRQWAYFVAESKLRSIKQDRSFIKILWVGRFISYKQPEMILKAIKRIDQIGKECKIEMIGEGPIRDKVQRLVRQLDLSSRVTIQNAVSNDVVREKMSEADIFIFPSNEEEGWGAVVVEAMFEGCVVVACREAGAPITLIEHNKTGFLFDQGDIQGLADIISTLINDPKKRSEIAEAGRLHVQSTWHPKIAAERLIGLSAGLLGKSKMPNYLEGPCAKVVL